jgi:sulfite oxidase
MKRSRSRSPSLIRLDGLAWGGESKIEKVELKVDRGRTWTDAVLAEPASRWSWREWSAEVEIAGATGLRHIGSRATDSAGRSQDWLSETNRLGYGNTAFRNSRST